MSPWPLHTRPSDDVPGARAVLSASPLGLELARQTVPAIWWWHDDDWRACPAGPTPLRDWLIEQGHEFKVARNLATFLQTHEAVRDTYSQSPRWALPFTRGTDDPRTEAHFYKVIGRGAPLAEAIGALYQYGVAYRALRAAEAFESAKDVRINRRMWARRALALRSVRGGP